MTFDPEKMREMFLRSEEEEETPAEEQKEKDNIRPVDQNDTDSIGIEKADVSDGVQKKRDPLEAERTVNDSRDSMKIGQQDVERQREERRREMQRRMERQQAERRRLEQKLTESQRADQTHPDQIQPEQKGEPLDAPQDENAHEPQPTRLSFKENERGSSGTAKESPTIKYPESPQKSPGGEEPAEVGKDVTGFSELHETRKEIGSAGEEKHIPALKPQAPRSTEKKPEPVSTPVSREHPVKTEKHAAGLIPEKQVKPSVTRASAHSDEHKTSKELESAKAGDFAPLRKAFTSTINKEDKTGPQKNAPTGKHTDKAITKDEGRGKTRVKKKKYVPPSPPGPLSILLIIGGGLSLVSSLVAIGIGKQGTAPVALAGIGLALTGVFALVNRRWLRQAVTSRSARYGTNVTIVILSLLGILICLNVIAYRYHYQLDMSAEGVHTLSPQSLQVVKDINRAGEDITVMAFIQPDSPVRTDIETLIDRYRYHTANIKYSVVDPDIKRDLTESKGIERIPSVLFEIGDNRTVVSDIDEPHFTSAFMAVRQTHAKVAAFLTGHGEADPYADVNSETGISKFRERLELDNYEVKTLSIPEANGVPSETSLLIIVSPQRTFEVNEINAIEDYLDEGGSLMVLLEPGRDAGLSGLLAKYGISLKEGIVLDDKRNAYGELPSPIAVPNPNHPITDSLSEGLVFLNAGCLDYTATTRLPQIETESLVRSENSSWVETTGEYEFNEGVDRRESCEMAILAQRPVGETGGISDAESGQDEADDRDDSDGVYEDESSDDVSETGDDPEGSADADESTAHVRMAKVLAVNDASFIRNANFGKFYNRDFVLNAANYMTSGEELLSIRAATREERMLDLSNVQRSVIFVVSVILTPLLIAGLGGIVWLKRR